MGSPDSDPNERHDAEVRRVADGPFRHDWTSTADGTLQSLVDWRRKVRRWGIALFVAGIVLLVVSLSSTVAGLIGSWSSICTSPPMLLSFVLITAGVIVMLYSSLGERKVTLTMRLSLDGSSQHQWEGFAKAVEGVFDAAGIRFAASHHPKEGEEREHFGYILSNGLYVRVFRTNMEFEGHPVDEITVHMIGIKDETVDAARRLQAMLDRMPFMEEIVDSARMKVHDEPL